MAAPAAAPDAPIDRTAATCLAGPDGRGWARFPWGAPAADLAAAIRRFMARESSDGG